MNQETHHRTSPSDWRTRKAGKMKRKEEREKADQHSALNFQLSTIIRQPSSDPPTVSYVHTAEAAAQDAFFVGDDEEVRHGEEDCGVDQKRGRHVEERSAGQGHSGADIHWVTHETIRPTDHELFRRIERRGRAFSDVRVSKLVPERNSRAVG